MFSTGFKFGAGFALGYSITKAVMLMACETIIKKCDALLDKKEKKEEKEN